ncbi:hypothetical protein GDO78_019455 [Eleutherodactylus coqui]|uniref:Uncharacterized protein n=1 Tax=Eleutherodactylus coqui TaxID=57060 RepID=A0A8J6B7S9_ELECQ|nr:hypothetical protein GDO78_019455 [Eleutherodactylus coqui]
MFSTLYSLTASSWYTVWSHLSQVYPTELCPPCSFLFFFLLPVLRSFIQNIVFNFNFWLGHRKLSSHATVPEEGEDPHDEVQNK